MVRTITLNDGKKIPSLGWGNMNGNNAVDNCALALKLGILHIDTAQVQLLHALPSPLIDVTGLSYRKRVGPVYQAGRREEG